MIPPGARVLLRAAAVDFRKGPEGLISLVRDAGADPFDGSLYVFRAKRADRIKIVWWDGSGLCDRDRRGLSASPFFRITLRRRPEAYGWAACGGSDAIFAGLGSDSNREIEESLRGLSGGDDRSLL